MKQLLFRISRSENRLLGMSTSPCEGIAGIQGLGSPLPLAFGLINPREPVAYVPALQVYGDKDVPSRKASGQRSPEEPV
ncbi:hypothetical protein [Pontibacter sp. HSC-36F09]|uniref:hypothetical protein n=1 Tax=Pontibacter sp. HSC-36F09 TaxID=2910966 RepID=UPI0020A01FD3|nr:hypothetical protein [Pontibacter sp. HSC-36F09]MCP2042558.1 hypothetical protein [Pontibacter sp. HSC-36F09]